MITDEQIISIEEATKEFNKAAKIADELGSALITENDNPKYMLVALTDELLKDAHKITVDEISKSIFEKYHTAFAELAKK